MNEHINPLMKAILDTARRRPMAERNEAREEQILDRERDEKRERLESLKFTELLDMLPDSEFDKIKKQIIDLILDQGENK